MKADIFKLSSYRLIHKSKNKKTRVSKAIKLALSEAKDHPYLPRIFSEAVVDPGDKTGVIAGVTVACIAVLIIAIVVLAIFLLRFVFKC